MAVEVNQQAYCFLPVNNTPTIVPRAVLEFVDATPSRENMDKMVKAYSQEVLNNPVVLPRKPVVSPPPFTYNPLHDFESIWWLAVWLLFYREVAPDGDDEALDEEEYRIVENQRREAYKLFHQEDCRSMALTYNGFFSGSIGFLHPSVQAAGYGLEISRAALVNAYTLAEQNRNPIDYTLAGEGVYENVAQGFFQAVSALGGEDIKVRPFGKLLRKHVSPSLSSSSSATSSSKRSRDDTAGSPVPESAGPPRKRARASFDGGPSTRTRSKYKLP